MENAESHGEGGQSARRRAYVSPKALVELYGDDGSKSGEWLVGRNASNLVEFLKSNFSNDQVVGLFIVEDEESSDPPDEGEPRMRAPLFPVSEGQPERMRVQDAISALVSAIVPDPDMVSQFRSLCDAATVRSGMDCAILTFVYSGRPAGFVFLNSCKDVPVSSLGTLYEASKSQVARMRDEFRRLAPGISFSDDPPSPAVLAPDGSPAGSRRVVTPEEASEEAAAAGMARVVSLA